MKPKYNIYWVGIDGGREGLWLEPLWTGVLTIISEHQGESVYDPHSKIYEALVAAFPREKWISKTREGAFRPLFRDYPHPWTRTKMVSLSNGKFRLTPSGQQVLKGLLPKTEVLIRSMQQHSEPTASSLGHERPFAILAQAFLDAPRPMTTLEMSWCVMQNYRPGHENIAHVLAQATQSGIPDAEGTPRRRLRNFLGLLRTVGAIHSHRRPSGQVWQKADDSILRRLAEEPSNP